MFYELILWFPFFVLIMDLTFYLKQENMKVRYFTVFYLILN